MYLSVALIGVVNTDARRCYVFKIIAAVLYPESVFGRKKDSVLLSSNIHKLCEASGAICALNSAYQHCLGMSIVSADYIEERVHSVAKINVCVSALTVHYIRALGSTLMSMTRSILFSEIAFGLNDPLSYYLSVNFTAQKLTDKPRCDIHGRPKKLFSLYHSCHTPTSLYLSLT